LHIPPKASPLFRIKICGITNVADAQAAAAAGADAIGLNFFSSSSRCVSVERAEEIVRALPSGVCKVGLFVNDSVERVRETYERLKLDAVQLHGDESPEFVAALTGIPVVKAFRIGNQQAAGIKGYVTACQQLGHPLSGMIVDAHVPGSFGGTGQLTDWKAAADLQQRLAVPLILAGGLTAANVGQAIAAVRPYGVDTASGVESSPGCKDPQQVKAFVTAAREALG
jgi:phosphoribosylanthranilate isomerase